MRFLGREDWSLPEILYSEQEESARRQIQDFVEQTFSKGSSRRAPRPDSLDEDLCFRHELAGRFTGFHPRRRHAFMHRIVFSSVDGPAMPQPSAYLGANPRRCKEPIRHCNNATKPSSPVFILFLLFIALGVVIAEEARAKEGTFKDRPADYWVEKLASGTVAEKRDAATAFAVIAPQREDVVELLIEELRQRTDYELQTDAANALMRIGPFAAEAVPALIETLGAPDIEDNSVREQAASALAAIVVNAPIALTERLEEATREAVVHGLLRAIGYLRMSDDRTLAAIFRVLNGRPSTLDNLYEKIVLTLDRIDAPAVPAIIKEMNKTQNVVALAGLTESLGRIHMSLADGPPPQEVVDALLRASQSADDWVVNRAIRALQLANARTADVALRLMDVLRDDTADAYTVGTAAEAGAHLFPEDDTIIELLTNRLKSRDDTYSADIISALQRIGVRIVAPIIKRLDEEPTPDLRYGAARTFRNPKFALGEVVAALAPGLNEKDSEVVVATAEALEELAPASLILVPRLSELAANRQEDVRSASLVALGTLAKYMLANETSASEIDGIKGAFASALALAQKQSLSDFVDPETEVLSPIANVIARLEQAQHAQVLFVVALISIVALSIILIVIASWRARRQILLLLGRRWILKVGQCEFESRVVASAEGIRITLQSSEASSAVFERIVPPCSFPDGEFLRTYRSALEPTSRTRIEVDEDLFGRPWASILVGSWAGNDAGIAGQIALSSRAPSLTKHYSRKLRFHAISNSIGNGQFNDLPMAESEASEIAEICVRWGAEAMVKNDARIADLRTSLLDADLVHVTAHATFDRILLADGDFSVEDLSLIDLARCRCRLLILSACEAGNLTQASALLWDLVRSGVNIIAATRPVHDIVCRVFFEEMYRTMLPARQAQGIELSQAVLLATQCTHNRLLEEFAVDDHPNVEAAFQKTMASFVLFGDPSLSLSLARRT